MFTVVLVHPEIPPNAGNVIRLAANTGARLHLVQPLGFSMDDKQLKRAGLDYHEYASVRVHADWQSCLKVLNHDRVFALSTSAANSVYAARFQENDAFVFGSETAGLPETVRAQVAASHRVRLPLRADQRSLNLSNAVAVAVFEAWRQLGYAGGA